MAKEAIRQEEGQGELRLLRFRDPHTALGHAVAQLMGKPGFARLPFGVWSKVLVGQINRNHYFFVAEGSRLTGFAGWTLTDSAMAEALFQGRAGPETAAESAAESAKTGTGDCLVINAWQAEGARSHAFILSQMRRIAAASGARNLFGRRSYPDGRSRLVRLALDRPTLARHLDPEAGGPEAEGP